MRDPGLIPAPLNENTCIISVPNEWSNITPFLSYHHLCEQQSKLSLTTFIIPPLYNDDNIFRVQKECSEQLVHIQPPPTLLLHPIYGAPPGLGWQWAPFADIPTGLKMFVDYCSIFSLPSFMSDLAQSAWWGHSFLATTKTISISRTHSLYCIL
jgi:hypothetical protein